MTQKRKANGQFDHDTSGASNIPSASAVPAAEAVPQEQAVAYATFMANSPNATYSEFTKLQRKAERERRRREQEEWEETMMGGLSFRSEDFYSDGDGEIGGWIQAETQRTFDVTGELAARIRQAFGVTDPNERVFIMEHEYTSGGNGDTEITSFGHTVYVGGESAESYDYNDNRRNFDGLDDVNGLVQLLAWLDKKSPKEGGG